MQLAFPKWVLKDLYLQTSYWYNQSVKSPTKCRRLRSKVNKAIKVMIQAVFLEWSSKSFRYKFKSNKSTVIIPQALKREIQSAREESNKVQKSTTLTESSLLLLCCSLCSLCLLHCDLLKVYYIFCINVSAQQ